MTATDDLDQVVSLSAEVAALRQRLAELNTERLAIEGQIADYVNRIAAAAAGAAASPSAATSAPPEEWTKTMPLGAAVLAVLGQSPGKAFSPLDIAGILKMTDGRDHDAIRTHLSRMARAGRVTRLSFGKYKAV